MTGYWAYFREENGAEASCIEGDFDGDGKADLATILIRKDGSGFAIGVFLSTRSSDRSVRVLLEETTGMFQPQDARLAVVEPGAYKTFYACDVRKGPSNMYVAHAAIDYFARQKERGGRGETKPQHWLWSWDDGTQTFTGRSLCSDAEWQAAMGR